mgnify:CR=1 FL=1
MCKLISYSAPEGPPYYANGPWRAVIKCEEHGMDMGTYFSQLPDQTPLCPIGKIEKATEEALAKIAAATT